MKPEAGTLLLFWDYDTQWGADRSRSGTGCAGWGPDEFPGTDRILELLAARSINACFAVVGAAALPGSRPYADPRQIRRIHEQGHESASHAMRHEWLPALEGEPLRATLRESRDALEQCIGDQVTSFVPPYNQPFDFPRRGAFSLSERREVPSGRTGIRQLCEALASTGYRFCRISYRSLASAILEQLLEIRTARPERLQRIASVTCARLNTPGGFARDSVKMLERCASDGGAAIVYGHPHSLFRDCPQHERWLVPFLDRAAALRDRGCLRIVVPRQLVS